MNPRLFLVTLALGVGCLASPRMAREAPSPGESSRSIILEINGMSSKLHNSSRYDVDPSDKVDTRASGSGEGPALEPVIEIQKLGRVRGSVTTSMRRKRTIYQFRGLPFAQPPVGNRRYQAPFEVQPWEGILDGRSSQNACIQVDNPPIQNQRTRRDVDSQHQSEDCLYLNVFTPMLNSSEKLPVLVFIHGGSFTSGSVRGMSPAALLDHDIVLVTPQYRLGPLGFLNLQEAGVPGNAGLFDQVQALRWVHDHIEAFGGDPQRVTLGGHSAGAASVSLLYLSPLTKGLIHAVMPMSGAPVSFWAWDHKPEAASLELSTSLGCGDDPVKRLACLRSKSASDIMHTFQFIAAMALMGGSSGMSGSVPSTQTSPGVKLLEDTPGNILRNKAFKPLPVMTGVTKHEGSFVVEVAVTGFLEPNGLLDDKEFLSHDLVRVLLRTAGMNDDAGFVADTTSERFFDQDTLGDFRAMRPGLIDLGGSFAFKSPAHEFAMRNALANASTYLYAFNYYGKNAMGAAGAGTYETVIVDVYGTYILGGFRPRGNTHYDLFRDMDTGTCRRKGIYHGADQIYLFPDGSKLNSRDEQMARILVQLVADFVTYHNPTPPDTYPKDIPTWVPYQRDTDLYMELASPLRIKKSFSEELVATRKEHFGQTSSTKSSETTLSVDNNDVTTTASGHRSTPQQVLTFLGLPLLLTKFVLA